MLRTSRPASAALAPTRRAVSASFRLLSPTSLRNSIATAPSFLAASTSSSGVSGGETIWLRPNFTARCIMCVSLKWIRIRRATLRATLDWASGVKGRARRRDDRRHGAGPLGLETGVGGDGGEVAVPGVGAVDLADPGRLDPVLQLDVVGIDKAELPVLHDRG